jgi:hypothetical protein
MKSAYSVSLMVLTAAMIFSAAACSQRTFLPGEDTVEAPPAAADSIQTVQFPANEDGKTAYSADIFAAAFSLTVSMPAGMTIDADESLFSDGIPGVFSNLPIVDSNGDKTGCVGYNVFDAQQPDGSSNGAIEPMMIYNQISLGNHYRFTIREKYEVVNDTDTLITAITGVYNDLELPAGKDYTESDYNYGVVAYSKSLAVYVAFDLNKNFFTRDQCEEIAKSIMITSNSIP